MFPVRELQDHAERGIVGNLASWQDMDGTRWLLASGMGPLHPEFKVPVTNGSAPNGFIAAFKVREQAGKATLEKERLDRLAPGVVIPYLRGDIHSTHAVEGPGVVFRFLSYDLEKIDRSRYNLEKQTIIPVPAR